MLYVCVYVATLVLYASSKRVTYQSPLRQAPTKVMG